MLGLFALPKVEQPLGTRILRRQIEFQRAPSDFIKKTAAEASTLFPATLSAKRVF
jgi:hypothetical protein